MTGGKRDRGARLSGRWLRGLLLALCLAPQAWAQRGRDSETGRLIQTLIQDTVHLLRLPGVDHQRRLAALRARLEPRCDSAFMARMVMGAPVWDSLTPAAREECRQLVLADLLARHAAALAVFTDETVDILRAYTRDDRSVVHVLVYGGEHKAQLEIRLHRQGDTWSIYEILLEGASQLKLAHARHAPLLRDGGYAAWRQHLRAELAANEPGGPPRE